MKGKHSDFWAIEFLSSGKKNLASSTFASAAIFVTFFSINSSVWFDLLFCVMFSLSFLLIISGSSRIFSSSFPSKMSLKKSKATIHGLCSDFPESSSRLVIFSTLIQGSKSKQSFQNSKTFSVNEKSHRWRQITFFLPATQLEPGHPRRPSAWSTKIWKYFARNCKFCKYC